MKKYIPLIFLFVAYYGLGQISYTTEEGAAYQFDNNISGHVIRVSGNHGNDVEGSEFLNEEWQQATVVDMNTKKKFKLLARFNAYTKEVEILKEKDIISLTPVDGISVELEGKNFVPFKPVDNPKPIFAEELVNGKLSLFRVYGTKVIKAASDSNLLGIDNKDRLTITDNLFIKMEDGTVSELSSKKKTIEKLFDERTLKFAKKEKLSVKKDEDLIDIIKFYNTKT
jgi:hypothetical protein